MRRDIRALDLRLSSLTEQVMEDHRQLLMGLATERDARKKQHAATKRAFRAVKRHLDQAQSSLDLMEKSHDKTDQLLIAHFHQSERRFQELTSMFQETFPELRWREAIKARLDQLEKKPPA